MTRPKIVACLSQSDYVTLDRWIRIYCEEKPKAESLKTSKPPMRKSLEQLQSMSNRELREYIRNVLNLNIGDAKNKEDYLNIICGASPTSQTPPKPQESCTIQLNSDRPITLPLPPGKTKEDLVALIYKFFAT